MSVLVVPALTVAETDLLTQAEAVIERGIRTFIEVGEALASVRDNRLYRDEFDTFEDYCLQRWGLERASAYRAIQSAQVAAILSPMGDKIHNERQARELAPLIAEPEKLRAAFAEVAERTNGKPTAAALREAVNQVLAPESEVAQIAHAELDRVEQRQTEVAEHNARQAAIRDDITPERHASIEEQVRPAIQFSRLVGACQQFLLLLAEVDIDDARRGLNPAKATPIHEAIDRLALLRRAMEATP